MKESITIEYQFGGVDVYLLFIRIEKEILVYMTNTKYSPLKVHMLYKKRWQIVKLRKEKPRTISELKRYLNIGYKSVWEHVRKLEKCGLVSTKTEITKIGKVVMVKFNDEVILLKKVKIKQS